MMSHVNTTPPFTTGTTTLNYDHGSTIDSYSYSNKVRPHHTYNPPKITNNEDSLNNPTFEPLEDENDLNDSEPTCWKMLHDPILASQKNFKNKNSEAHHYLFPLINSNPDSSHFRLDGKIISINTPTKYNKIQTLDPEDFNTRKVDPRQNNWLSTKPKPKKTFKLPKFDVDNNYIGKLPNKVLILSRLSTSMTKDILEEEIFRLYGEPNIEKISLYAPPHSAPEPTGLAKIVFKNSQKCRQAQQYLDQKQIWKSVGCIHACFDPKGTWLKTLFDLITQGKIEPENAPSKDDFDRKQFKPGKSRNSKNNVKNETKNNSTKIDAKKPEVPPQVKKSTTPETPAARTISFEKFSKI